MTLHSDRSSRFLQQPNRRVERRRAQVHVALSHRQVHVSCELPDLGEKSPVKRLCRAGGLTIDTAVVVVVADRSPMTGTFASEHRERSDLVVRSLQLRRMLTLISALARHS